MNLVGQLWWTFKFVNIRISKCQRYEPMPNRLNGILPRSLHTFRNGVLKTEYLTKICGFSGILYVQWPPEHKRTENIWVAPYASHNDHHAESSLAISWPPLVSPAHCYQKSLLPAYQALMEKRIFRWVTLFCCIISHSYIILPKISCKLLLTKVSMQNIKLPKFNPN